MQLTKAQRFIIYCIMAKESERPEYGGMYGFCMLLESVFGSSVLLHELPELNEKETGRYTAFGIKYEQGLYRFKDWKERRKAIKQCIEETADF